MTIIKNTISNLLGSITPIIVGLITIPIFLRSIGYESYGILIVIWAVLGYLNFLDLGVGRAITRNGSNNKNYNINELIWSGVILLITIGTISSLLMWISLDFILQKINQYNENEIEEVKKCIRIILLALPFLLIKSVFIGALQARLKFNKININIGITGILVQITPLIFALLGYKTLYVLVIATIIPKILSMCIMYIQCKQEGILSELNYSKKIIKDLIKYGRWITILNILAPLLVTADRIIISVIKGANFVPYYTIPYDLVSRSTIITSSLSSALFPHLAMTEEESGKKISIQASITLAAVMTPITLVGIGFSHLFLRLWLGNDFAQNCVYIAELILIGYWINCLVIPHYIRFIAVDNPRYIVMIYMIEVPIYFLMMYYSISKWGVLGAAISWVTRVIIDTILLLKLNKVFFITIKKNKLNIFMIMLNMAVLILNYNYIFYTSILSSIICILVNKNQLKLLLKKINV